jgi:hypothetical protein
MDSNCDKCDCSVDTCVGKTTLAPVYIQPTPPKSCKPADVYKKPTVPVEGGTVYKLSYPGIDEDTIAKYRRIEIRHQDNLVPGGGMGSDTTHRHDYRKWTQDDSTRPAGIRTKRDKYEKPTDPFDCDSVYKLSYKLPGEFIYVPVESSTGYCECPQNNTRSEMN